tara:strand:- start:4520 stop:5089 length:570 start_codon:yes stop_codon:yes gene_type:complete
MAKNFLKANVGKDIQDQFDRDYNTFLKQVLIRLSSDKKESSYSPIDTGFFASSWTVGRSRPVPQERRENVAPWSNIKANRKGKRSPQAVVQPRYINRVNYNFKIYENIFIGNTTKYAAFALASPRNHIVRYFKNDFRMDMDKIFRDKKSKIGLAVEPFTGGQGGIGQFADPDRTFVSYENLSDISNSSD